MLMDARIENLIEPTIRSFGLELWGCELSQNAGGNLLRIYVDSEDGVTVDACAELSRRLSSILDAKDVIHGRYTLEVSSPGIERSLFRLTHYQKFVGQQIKIRLRIPRDNRRTFSGLLVAVQDHLIVLRIEKQTYEFEFNDIEKGHLIAAF